MQYLVKDFPQNSFGKNVVTSLDQSTNSLISLNFITEPIQFIVRFEPIQEITLDYGGFRPPTTNVLCLQGSLDPWRKLGYTTNTTSGVMSVYIEGNIICVQSEMFINFNNFSDQGRLMLLTCTNRRQTIHLR